MNREAEGPTILQAETRVNVDGDQIASRVMDGEAILINLANGLYYKMAGVGGWIWSLLENQHSIAEIADRVSLRFSMAADEVLPDIQRVAAELLAEELVRTVDADAAANEVAEPVLPASYAAPVLEKYSDMADMFALDPPLPGLADVPARELPDRSED